MTSQLLAATGADFPWWTVPLVLLGLLLGIWLLLSGRKRDAVVFDVAQLLAPAGAPRSAGGEADRVPIRADAADLFRRIQSAGHRVVVLAYAPASLEPVLRAQSWAKNDVDAVVVSGSDDHVGLDDELAARVEKAARASKGAVHFVGDVTADVKTAQDRGWKALRSLNDEDTLAWLRDEDLLPRG